MIAAQASTLLRPAGMMQQPPPAGVIVPSAIIPTPPTGILPAIPPTSCVMPAHATMMPLPHSVSDMAVPAASEIPLNATATLPAGYSVQPLAASANGIHGQTVNSLPNIGAKSPQHEGMYVSGAVCNVNNNAMHQSGHAVADLSTDGDCEAPVQRDVLEHSSGVVTCEEFSGGDVAGTACVERVAAVDSCPVSVSVNGDVSMEESHAEVMSSSASSSVTSPGSTLADVTLSDGANDRDAPPVSSSALTTEPSPRITEPSPRTTGYSPRTTEPSPRTTLHASTSQQSSATTSTVTSSSPAAAKPKAPSWASLLKDTTSATNAIVINANNNHAGPTHPKADVKSAIKEPATQQSTVSHVSNDDKLKLEISGLYVDLLP